MSPNQTELLKDKDAATNTVVEFAIKVKDEACLEDIKEKLNKKGKIQEFVLDENEVRMSIATDDSWINIQEILEKNGYESAMVGLSEESAVSILESTAFKGVIRFCNIPNRNGIVIDGVIDVLQSFKNLDLSIFEYGDIKGDMGNIYKSSNYAATSNEQGRVIIKTVANQLNVPEIIGRGVCVTDGNERACGVIARSAGIFQNYKRICLCSGKVLWDERDLPKIVRNT